ncbi:MAG TPA: hypothetical protein PKY19_04095 [Oscillospiraceae bacterium]|nr:hypothetical protein [Oscillospiraceae bacterium]HXK77645.1 hypothetical protein [Oscillospiraceae bacterium]
MPQRVSVHKKKNVQEGETPARRVFVARRKSEGNRAFLENKKGETCRVRDSVSAGKGDRRDVSHRAPERVDPMTLTLEDDSVLRLLPLVVITYGGREYLALTPAEKKSEDVYFYEFITHPEGGIELLGIRGKDVLDAVLDEFDVWFDEQLRTEGD